MDDFFDDLDGEDDGNGDDGFHEEDCGDNFFDGPDWEDWMIIGPLSEEIADEKRDQERLEEENSADADKDYWDIINERDDF
jgi:hypothetical protein